MSAQYSRHGSAPESAPADSYFAYFEDPEAAATNLRLTMYRAGDWTFAVQVVAFGMVQGEPCEQPVSGLALASANARAGEKKEGLTIERKRAGGQAYVPIDAENNKLLAGQWVDLRVVGKGEITDVQWTIPDKSFKDYEANDTEGTLTHLKDADKKSETVQFYWADSGDKKVAVQAKVNGEIQSGSATLTVLRPDGALGAEQGSVFVDEYNLKAGPGLYLALARGPNGRVPGMAFKGKVTLPPGFRGGEMVLCTVGRFQRHLEAQG